MAKKKSNKYSYGDIPNLLTDWENDPTNGKPFSGESVQKFIKGKLTKHDDSVMGVRVNNQRAEQDAQGFVDILVPTVDNSLNEESTNPIGNAIVAQEIKVLKEKAIGGMHTEDAGDGENAKLIIENENGDEITSCLIPKASDGGGQSYARVTASVNKTRIKQGDSVVLTWGYNHLNGDGTPTGTAAETITIRVVNGTTETYKQVLSNISDGTSRQLTLGPDVLQAGTIGIYVIASVKLDDGTEQKAQGYKGVSVVTIDLTSTFDPAGQLSLTDGYVSGQIDIPFTLTGPRGSAVTLWLDGEQYDTTTINTSATTVGHFYVPAASLSAGKHTVQVVAESDGLLSNVVYCDFRKAGDNSDYLGVKMYLSAETMSDLPKATPVSIDVTQFADLGIIFGAWNAESNNSTISVVVDGVNTQTLTADRTSQSLSQRFDTAGTSTMVISNNTASLTLQVVVNAAEGIDEQEASDYVLKLSATGRSNSESATTRSDWGGVTTFENVDWKTSGWMRKGDADVLALLNGAKAIINHRPFRLENTYSVEGNGMTVECELMISQVLERGARVMGCMFGDPALGFDITTEEASLHLAQMQKITTAEKDEDGNIIEINRELGVSNHIAPDKWMKVAFVVQPNVAGQRKVFLYINGVLSKANQYETGLSLVQGTPQGITFDSDKADVYIRSLRIYERPLSENEILSNFIIDRPTAAEIQTKHEENVVAPEGSVMVVDPQTLIEKGRGVLVIIGKNSKGAGTVLDELYSENNKKYDGLAEEVHWYSPLGREYDFVAYNVYIRIQGTSSTKYPWKNIRIYLTKGPFTSAQPCRIVFGGVTYEQQYNATKDKWQLLSADGKEFKGFPLRGSSKSIEQAVLCAKTDFVDSSMVLNTGGAILYDDVMRAMGLLTPPQQYDERVRQSIDGIPCDIFCGETSTSELSYYGQHNLNNEKSKSGKIFGMEGVKDSNGNAVDFRKYTGEGANRKPIIDTDPIALEALDNGSPMTLFQSAGSDGSDELEAQLLKEFDGGFEFNVPEDTYWNPAKISDPKKESVASDGMKKAVSRLMGWLYDVTPEAMRTNPDYGDRNGWSDESKAKWVSQRFKDEAKEYFNVNHLLCYYLFTDYHASVDQRAKNIIWRTWDGLIWYSTYYDGDTAHSIRNDAFMVYLYNVTRDTYDDERNKYAFEGHNSRLWCLVLANMEEELRNMAAEMRAKMTLAKMLETFNKTIMDNWSERQYNASQMIKYVNTMEKQNYVYTLTGNREAHRTAFLTDRSQLLDARYGTGDYQADYMGIRVGREEADAPDVVRVKSGDLYYFGWKLSNGAFRYGPQRATMGEYVDMPITGKLSSANDPLAVCGASRITELDLTGMHGHMAGDFDLSRCAMLSKLIMRNDGNNRFNGVIMSFGSISKLEYIDLTGQTATGTNQAGTALDVSGQSRLRTLLAGDTSLQLVTLPEGAPISTLTLPASITRLSLRYLASLTRSGLTLQGTENIKQFLFAECPNLDWQTLLAECPNVEYIRVEGIRGTVRASFLEQYIDKKGYDANGSPVTFPALVGEIRLSDVVSTERLQTLKDTFKYLDIIEAEWSVYKENDNEIATANITNLDNLTGYDYNNEYEPSGHLMRLWEKSKPVRGDYDPNTEEMTLTLISETTYKQYADGSTFDNTDQLGEGFDCFMYVPRFWYKGVNDYLRQEKYTLLSANKAMPTATETKRNEGKLSELLFSDRHGISFAGATIGSSIDSALRDLSSSAVFRINVENMKRVRYPGLAITTYGSVFTDAAGVILQKDNVDITAIEDSPLDFASGDYIFRDIPDGAVWLYFTFLREQDDDDHLIFATDSNDIEAIEPGWVLHHSELIGIYGASIDNTGLIRSLSGKVSKRGNETNVTSDLWKYDADGNPTNRPEELNFAGQDFYNLCLLRGKGYHDVSYEQNKIIAVLCRLYDGDRNEQALHGQGGPAGYTTGQRDTLGKRWSSPTAGMNKIWGLEAWVACNWEFMDHVGVNINSFKEWKAAKRPQTGPVNAKWHIYDPFSDSERVVQGLSESGRCIARVKHGRHCDIIASSLNSDTSKWNTCFAAINYYSASSGRVVGRASGGAFANGGCVYAVANNASTSSYTAHGARLAFSGKIANEEIVDAEA